MRTKIKSILLFTTAILGATVILGVCSSQNFIGNNKLEPECDETAIEGYTVYVNPERGFSFQYPSTWKEDFLNWDVIITIMANENGLPQILVNAAPYSVKEGNLDGIADATLEEIRPYFENFREVERVSLKLAGLDAKKITYTSELAGLKLRSTLFICLYENQKDVYYITFLEDGRKESDTKTIENVIKSFCIFPGKGRK